MKRSQLLSIINGLMLSTNVVAHSLSPVVELSSMPAVTCSSFSSALYTPLILDTKLIPNFY